MGTVGSVRGQEGKVLQIDSPREGTVVHPGDTITITVSSPSGTAVGPFFVLGEGGIVADQIAGRLPAQFQVLIPKHLAPREYMVSAVGKTENGQEAAAEIILDVEMPDSSTHGSPAQNADPSVSTATAEKLTAHLASLSLESQGQQYPLTFIATYSNGAEVNVTESSRLVLRSANPNIAKVDTSGMVTAVNPGETTITAIYLEGGRSVRVNVPVTVDPQIVTAMPAALDFGPIPVGGSSQRQVRLTFNTENPTIGFKSIKITGSFSQTNDCPSVSAKRTQSTCTVTVTLTATQPGMQRGELTLYDNFATVPTTIPLIGKASAQ